MAENIERPPRVQPRIIAAPKIRQLYWCDFWRDAHLPEMWKTRPVVVISYKNTLSGPCLVVPFSTEPQNQNPWAVKYAIEGTESWAVCNHLCTVAPSRFTQYGGKKLLLPEFEFNQVLEKIGKWLPRPFDID
jgi:mRNA interferase MazF